MGLSERERLAEEYARKKHPWCKYPRGSGSAVVHESLLDFLAGYASRATAFEELLGVLEKAPCHCDSLLDSDCYRCEALAKYGKGE